MERVGRVFFYRERGAEVVQLRTIHTRMYNWRSLTWSRAPHFDQGLTRVYPDEVDEGRVLLNSSVAPFLIKKKTDHPPLVNGGASQRPREIQRIPG